MWPLYFIFPCVEFSHVHGGYVPCFHHNSASDISSYIVLDDGPLGSDDIQRATEVELRIF